MKVLVFGKTGQVASELAHHDGVTCVGRDVADLSDPTACATLIQKQMPDAVINAAAYTAVDRCEEEEALATIINGDAPTAMAKACAELEIPFVHISTDYVFDGEGEAAFKITDTVSPLNAYGRSKSAGEQGIADAGGVYCILRTSWVISAHGNNFVKTMLRLSETRDALSIVADQVGGPTPASAIAAACMSICHQLRENGADLSGVQHFSGQPDTTWANLARAVFEGARRQVHVTDILTEAYPTPARRPLNSRLDCTQLKRQFDVARPDWRDALKQILADLEHPAPHDHTESKPS